MMNRKLLYCVIALLLAAAILAGVLSPNQPRAEREPLVVKNETPHNHWYLLHLSAAVGAEKHTTAFNTRIENLRKSDGSIVTTITSNQFKRGLEVEWALLKTSTINRRADSGVFLAEIHRDQKDGTTKSALFGYSDKKNTVPCIAISGQTIPFDHLNYTPMPPFLSKDYPIIAFPLITRVQSNLESILLVDINKNAIVGIYPRHPHAANGRPNFVLDTKNDILIVADFYLDWIMAIDLRIPEGK